jgi:hypothetical protein
MWRRKKWYLTFMCLVLGRMAGALASVSAALLSSNILHLTVRLGSSHWYSFVLELLYKVHNGYDLTERLAEADVFCFAGG